MNVNKRRFLSPWHAGESLPDSPSSGVSTRKHPGWMGKLGLLSMLMLTLAVLSACASVKSYKVHPEDGKKFRGSKEGIPYYRPRPYLAVKAPFPIRIQEFVVAGKVNDDKSISIPAGAVPEDVGKHLTVGPPKSGGYLLPASMIVRVQKPSETPPVAPEGDAAKEEKGKGEKGKDEKPEKPDTPADQKPDKQKQPGEPDKPSQGKPEEGVTASTVVKISDFYDVVYLPDMQQSYVLQLGSGLGKNKSSINLQGGMLNSIALDTDNTEPAKIVQSAVATLGDIAKLIAAVEFPPAAALSTVGKEVDKMKQLSAVAGLQAEDVSPEIYVPVRIRWIEEALPGLYPIPRVFRKGTRPDLDQSPTPKLVNLSSRLDIEILPSAI